MEENDWVRGELSGVIGLPMQQECPVRVLAIFPFHRATEDPACAGGHSYQLVVEGEDRLVNGGVIVARKQSNISCATLDVDHYDHP